MARNRRDRFGGISSLHVDDGSGRCEYDYEDWPCAIHRLGVEKAAEEGLSLAEWVRDGEARVKEERNQAWKDECAPIISAAEILGLEEIAEVLRQDLDPELRRYSPYTKRMPDFFHVPADELIWLLKKAAKEGLRAPWSEDFPEEPKPSEESKQVAPLVSEGLY